MLEVIAYPQGGIPAEITGWFCLESTDGPIQHLQSICLSKHWLTSRVETVDRQWPVTRSPGGGAAELTGPGRVAGARLLRDCAGQ